MSDIDAVRAALAAYPELAAIVGPLLDELARRRRRAANPALVERVRRLLAGELSEYDAGEQRRIVCARLGIQKTTYYAAREAAKLQMLAESREDRLSSEIHR